MAFRNIEDNEISVGRILTVEVITALRDNLTALIEGDGSTLVETAALLDFMIGPELLANDALGVINTQEFVETDGGRIEFPPYRLRLERRNGALTVNLQQLIAEN